MFLSSLSGITVSFGHVYCARTLLPRLVLALRCLGGLELAVFAVDVSHFCRVFNVSECREKSAPS